MLQEGSESPAFFARAWEARRRSAVRGVSGSRGAWSPDKPVSVRGAHRRPCDRRPSRTRPNLAGRRPPFSDRRPVPQPSTARAPDEKSHDRANSAVRDQPAGQARFRAAEPPRRRAARNDRAAHPLPRVTPVCDCVEGDTFWIVAQRGHDADYVRNIEVNPRVRVNGSCQARSGAPGQRTSSYSHAAAARWIGRRRDRASRGSAIVLAILPAREPAPVGMVGLFGLDEPDRPPGWLLADSAGAAAAVWRPTRRAPWATGRSGRSRLRRSSSIASRATAPPLGWPSVSERRSPAHAACWSTVQRSSSRGTHSPGRRRDIRGDA
jgi:F420H(2)-dependent quinone reductase